MNSKLSNKLKASAATIAIAISCFAADVSANTYDSDTRIKTFVFTDNEVFTVVARNNFQTNIEFGKDENIETISVGDPIGWQVTPAGRRVFVKPLQRRGVSNLLVITSKHTYQFELVAQDSASSSSNHAYLVRFFYPEENVEARVINPEDRTRGDLRPVSNTPIPEIPIFQPQSPEISAILPGDVPVASPPPVVSVSPLASNTPSGGLNYNYTLTGPEAAAPIKIYDNGQSTYFEYLGALPNPVNVSELGNDKQETPVQSRIEGSAIVVDKISPKFTIRSGNGLITVFNESIKAQGF